MFRMSFNQNVAENFEEQFSVCVHVYVGIGLCT